MHKRHFKREATSTEDALHEVVNSYIAWQCVENDEHKVMGDPDREEGWERQCDVAHESFLVALRRANKVLNDTGYLTLTMTSNIKIESVM